MLTGLGNQNRSRPSISGSPRVTVAKTAVKALGNGLKLGPPLLDPEVVKAAEHLSHKEMTALGLAEPELAKDRWVSRGLVCLRPTLHSVIELA